jgi:Tfp pilus assembly protein PilF
MLMLWAVALLWGMTAGCAHSPKDNAKLQQAYIEDMKQAEALEQQQNGDDVRRNYLALARDLVKRRFYDVALVQLEMAQQDEARNPEVYYLMGVCHREASRPDQAEAAFKRTLALDARYAPAHDGLGQVLEQQGRKEAALKSFQKAVVLNPGRAGFHNNLGYALLTAGRFEEAETSLLKCLDLDPADQTARNNLAICYAYQGRDHDALMCLLRHNPPPIAYRNMAAVYRLMDRPDKAAAMEKEADALEQIVAVEPPPETIIEDVKKDPVPTTDEATLDENIPDETIPDEATSDETTPDEAAPVSTPPADPEPPGRIYAVQVGAFLHGRNARDLVARLKTDGYPAYIHEIDQGDRHWFLTRIGDYATLADAQRAAADFTQRTGDPAVVTRPDSIDPVTAGP